MSTVVPLHRRGQTTDTGDRKVRPMDTLQLTSSIRIDLERTPPSRRRAVIFDLIGLPEHTPVTLYVGDLGRPDPALIYPIVDALLHTRISLHVEGTPAACKAWINTVGYEQAARWAVDTEGRGQ